MFVLTFVPDADYTLRDSSVHGISHEEPIVLLSMRFAHKSLPWMSGYQRVVREVQDGREKCFRYHDLDGSIEC